MITSALTRSKKTQKEKKQSLANIHYHSLNLCLVSDAYQSYFLLQLNSLINLYKLRLYTYYYWSFFPFQLNFYSNNL